MAEPLQVRWDRTVIPSAGTGDDTIVCCLDQHGHPVALFLDDEHREALGLSLLDPNGEMDQAGDALAPQQCPAGVHADWAVDSENAHACPWCEIDRLGALITRAQNAADGDDMVAVRAALADSCPRCNGSGIDPEHSSPGCTDPDRGAEPPNLEPCIACQYPLPETEWVDEPTCGVLNPTVAAACTEPNDHSSPIHRDAFGNTWTRRDGERPLSIPTV